MSENVGTEIIKQINLLLKALKELPEEDIIDCLSTIEKVTQRMSPQTVTMMQMMEVIALTTQVYFAIKERFPNIEVRPFNPVPIPKSILN